MISQGFLGCSDMLYFEFKNYTFYCRISDGGLLYDCYYKEASGTKKSCFEDYAGFDSLTHWSDMCVQDICGEYVTRFSAWKRVRLSKTNQVLGEIRDNYRRKKVLNQETAAECARCANLSRLNILCWQQNKLMLNMLKSWRERLKSVLVKDVELESQFAAIDALSRDSCNITPYVIRHKLRVNVETHQPSARQPVSVVCGRARKRKHMDVKPETRAQSVSMNASDVICASKSNIENVIMDESVSDDAFNRLLISFFGSKSKIN